jgi:hypothetical protein
MYTVGRTWWVEGIQEQQLKETEDWVYWAYWVHHIWDRCFCISSISAKYPSRVVKLRIIDGQDVLHLVFVISCCEYSDPCSLERIGMLHFARYFELERATRMHISGIMRMASFSVLITVILHCTSATKLSDITTLNRYQPQSWIRTQRILVIDVDCPFLQSLLSVLFQSWSAFISHWCNFPLS